MFSVFVVTWILDRVVELVRERVVVMYPWPASVEVIPQVSVVIGTFLSSVVLVDGLRVDSSRSLVVLADRLRLEKGSSVVVLVDRLRAVNSLLLVMLADRVRAVDSSRASEVDNSLLMVVLVAKLLGWAVLLTGREMHQSLAETDSLTNIRLGRLALAMGGLERATSEVEVVLVGDPLVSTLVPQVMFPT